MNFVFTGPAKVVGTRIVRDDLKNLATTTGHTVKGSVTKCVDYVVCSAPDFMDRKGSKLIAADRLGIECISPSDFIEMCGGKIELRLEDLVA